MFISHLVVVPLLTAVCALPAVAQTPLASNSATLTPQVKPYSDSSDRILVDQFRLPAKPLLDSDSRERKSEGLESYDFHRSYDIHPSLGLPLRRFLKPDTDQTDSASICYSIRNYRMKRDDPQTDVTRPDGYSTCQPATRFAVKSVEDSPQLIRR
jgi:hypothetical protein